MEPVIDVDELRCRYGDFEAVRGVSFVVQPGELFALLGTNGAGKTTTMETLEGHRTPAGGAVRVFGANPHADRARVRSRTGIMLQESGFAGDLTVLETIRLWEQMISRRGDAAATLDALDLSHRADVAVKQLSGGERRRLDLALAVFGGPELLFLDEPTTGLDPESRKRTWEVIRGLLDTGSTVLLTTHYLEEAEALASRLAIMHEGEIAVSGDLADVLGKEPGRISFEQPGELALPTLSARPQVSDGQVQLRTNELQHDLHLLLSWADVNGVRLHRLRASEASLEDVFHGVRESPELV